MSRRGILLGALAMALAAAAPSVSLAYFPPDIGLTPPPNAPPDPFGVPGQGGLGEPEPPDPGPGPNVQTPEPASIVTALTGLAMAGAFAWRRRMRKTVAA